MSSSSSSSEGPSKCSTSASSSSETEASASSSSSSSSEQPAEKVATKKVKVVVPSSSESESESESSSSEDPKAKKARSGKKGGKKETEEKKHERDEEPLGRPSLVNSRISVVGRPSVSYEAPDKDLPRASLEVARAFELNKQEETIRLKQEKAKGKKLSKKDKKRQEAAASRHVIAHTYDTKQLKKEYGTSIDSTKAAKSKGLTDAQVEAAREKWGPNLLSKVKTTPLWVRFLLEFVQFFPLLLEVGGAACFLAFALEKSADSDAANDNLYLGIILWLVVIITAIFSFMQEAKSDAMMSGFADMEPEDATVRRNGKTLEVPASELVPGDIVKLSSGDKIPADMVIIWAERMKVNNSSLTGEMEPVSRSAKFTDDNHLETANLAFSSSFVEQGDCYGVVYAIGDQTEIGHIADMVGNTEQEPTPLRVEISRFIQIVAAVAIALGVVFFIVMLIILGPEAWTQALVTAIGIIVANVPEGLLPTLTVALTLTAKKLAKKQVQVKNLEAVETLGSCSTICSDKTGTLTLNQMTVVVCYFDNASVSTNRDEFDSGVIDPETQPTYRRLRQLCALNNRTGFAPTEENMAKHPKDRDVISFGGNASEVAMLRLAGEDEDKPDFGDVEDYRKVHEEVFGIPFDSEKKWQMSIHQQPEDVEAALKQARKQKDKFKMKSKMPYILTIKGAPERVIAKCTSIEVGGKVRDINQSDKDSFEDAYDKMAAKGRRVLGFAYLMLDRDTYSECYEKGFEFSVDEQNYPEEGFVFAGLTGLEDPPRPEVPGAVADCHRAGIRVIMVTGDHPKTAEAIARQVGILVGDTPEQVVAKSRKKSKKIEDVTLDEAPAIVIKGSDIDGLEEKDWVNILDRKEIVFARTSPEQKLQIVGKCQDRGEIVAVTGDGVNDAPALRKSNLGCAMGITGTAVAQEAADIILKNDSFDSIVVGVRQGRIIFDNLKKSITYTLSSNFAELLPFAFFVIFGLPLALSAVLILCIDLGTDMIPAISLAYEKPEANIMNRPPRHPTKDRLVTLKLAIFAYLWLGFIQAAAGFLNYFLVFQDAGFAGSSLFLFGDAKNFFNKNAKDLVLNENNGTFELKDEDHVDGEDEKTFTVKEQMELLYQAQSAFFIGVVITRMGCVMVCKTRTLSLLKHGVYQNIYLDLGLCFELVLALALTLVPFLNDFFFTRPVAWDLWFIPLYFLLFTMVTDELRKFILRKNAGKEWTNYISW